MLWNLEVSTTSMMRKTLDICSCIFDQKLVISFQKPDVISNEYLKKFKMPMEFMDDFDVSMLGKFSCVLKGKIMPKYEKTLEEVMLYPTKQAFSIIEAHRN